LAGVERELRLAIERGTARQNAFQILHRLGAGLHGARVTLRHDPPHVVLRTGLQPNRGAVAEQLVECRRVGHQAPGGGNDDGIVVFNGLFECALLVSAVRVQAIQRLNFRQATASKFFDLVAQFSERTTQRSARRPPSVVLPAPRRPIKAMRRERASGSWAIPKVCEAA